MRGVFAPSAFEKRYKIQISTYLASAELREHVLAGALDRAGRVTSRDVGQRAQWEVRLQLSAKLSDERLPHQTARCVVGEGEVNSLVEELLEFLLVAFMGLRSARHDRDASLVRDPLSAPLAQGLLDTIGVGLIVLLGLLLTLLLLFLGWPDLFSLINVNQ